ncbi:MAG TPA: hypothetical protein VFX50_12225, partial [Gemmatimonadales bacterium]|nr:hypothetical protein [Gemmatimonadales bacterium]
LLGVGLLQKPTYGVLLPLPGLAVLLLPSRPLRARLVLAAGLTIVALVPAGLGLAWFVANDALPWLLEGYLTFNLEVSRQLVGGVPRATVITAVRAIDSPPLVLAIPAAVVGALHLWARDRRAFALFLAWIGGAVLSMAVQRRWFPYHWFNLAWAMAPLAGIGFARALRAHPRDAAAARAIAVTTLAMLTLWFVFPLQQRVREWAQYLTGALPDREAYVGQFAPTESGIILDDLALARWLEVNTAPDDKVFVWDSPLANALAQRRAPTRVGFFVPLTLADRNRRQAIPLGPIQLAMRAEFMHALDHDTRVVAVTRASLEGREEYLRKSVPELYPEFHRTLRERWVVVDSAREYLIFAPHDGGGAPPAGPGGH